MTRAPATIAADLDTVRARRTSLDRAEQVRDLTATEDHEWAALDLREASLTAEFRDWIYQHAGITAERLQGALA